jgi:hypothetical protein
VAVVDDGCVDMMWRCFEILLFIAFDEGGEIFKAPSPPSTINHQPSSFHHFIIIEYHHH